MALSGRAGLGHTDELIAALCRGETVTDLLVLAQLIAVIARKSLDSRVRGNDVLIRPGYLSELSNQPSIPRHSQSVIPANAGSALLWRSRTSRDFRAKEYEVANVAVSIFRLSRCLRESRAHRLQAFSLEKPWMFGFDEVKQSPPSRE
ncbi:hypothetical protein [Lysobacter capsici]|uniref:hypothetical protein n=1 Tax=Lysobacter capsici TaxID=435897 RepID=UPI0012FD639E|nr:hypothetical protein [Lysobacter capsici]